MIKSWSIIIICSLFICHIAFAVPGDRVDPTNNALWQLAAMGFVQTTLTTANNLSPDWRAWQAIDILQGWLLIQAGQPIGLGGTGKIYEKGVYSTFLGRFQYFSYGDSISMQINPTYAPPANVTVIGSLISCDNPISGTIRLYKLINQMYFVEQAIDGIVNGTRLEFPGVSAGKYVLGFSDDLNRLPTVFLTVS